MAPTTLRFLPSAPTSDAHRAHQRRRRPAARRRRARAQHLDELAHGERRQRLVGLVLDHVLDDGLARVEGLHRVQAQALRDQHDLLLLLEDEQVLLADVVVRHLQNGLQVDQAHDLAAAQRDVQRARVLLALLVHLVHVRHVVVRQIAADLRHFVLLHVPPDRLQLLQPPRLVRSAARRAHVQRQPVRLLLRALPRRPPPGLPAR